MEINLSVPERRTLARYRVKALRTAIDVFGGHAALCKELGIGLPKKKRLRKKRAKQAMGAIVGSMMYSIALDENVSVLEEELVLAGMKIPTTGLDK